MKNISKRVLVILMAGLLLASCGNTEVPSESIESVSETASETVSETELTDGIPPTDMDGYTLNILNYSENNPNYNWSLYQIDATELSGSPVNDAIFNRNLEVETRFNAEIQEIPCDNTQTSVPIDVQAGDTNYQIAMIWDNKVTNLLTQGVLQMWNDMPGINLDNPWWNADANNAYSYKNQQYAVIGDFNLSEYSKSYVVFLNKNLYASLHSVEDLYTLIQDGGWTYDTYWSLAKQYVVDLNGDGTFDTNDQFGVGGIPRVLFQSLFVGANQKAVEIDAEGLPYCAMLGNEEFITYVQKIISDFSSDNVYLNLRESSDNGLSAGMFRNGQILFYTRTIWDITTFRESDFSLGVLPAPKKDAQQDRYYCVTTGGVASVLPSTVPESDKEYTGLLLEAMSFASRKDVLPIYKEVILKSKYSDSQDDSAMVDIIFESQTYDLGITIYGQSGDFINNIMTDLKPDVVSYLAANENKYTTAITKIAEAIEEYIE